MILFWVDSSLLPNVEHSVQLKFRKFDKYLLVPKENAIKWRELQIVKNDKSTRKDEESTLFLQTVLDYKTTKHP